MSSSNNVDHHTSTYSALSEEKNNVLNSVSDIRLHFLCGKIASGKSTLAKSLAKNPRTILISEDTWLSRLYPGEIKTIADYVEKSALIKSVLEEHIAVLLKAGNTIVMDFPANTKKQRSWLKSLASNAQLPYLFHILKVDDSECKRRLILRSQTDENPFKTTEDEFDLITEHFSYPTVDEKLKVKEYC